MLYASGVPGSTRIDYERQGHVIQPEKEIPKEKKGIFFIWLAFSEQKIRKTKCKFFITGISSYEKWIKCMLTPYIYSSMINPPPSISWQPLFMTAPLLQPLCTICQWHLLRIVLRKLQLGNIACSKIFTLIWLEQANSHFTVQEFRV